MPQFRKKPVVIEAVQWTGANLQELMDWAHGGMHPAMNRRLEHNGQILYIRTLEGPLYASVNDWIIRGVKGEYYPCKPDVFAVTYEPVDVELPF